MTRRSSRAAALPAVVFAANGAASQGVKPMPGDTEWVTPAAEKATTSPIPTTPASVERGRSLYVKQCSACHGGKGKGDGPLAKRHAEHHFVRTLGPAK